MRNQLLWLVTSAQVFVLSPLKLQVFPNWIRCSFLSAGRNKLIKKILIIFYPDEKRNAVVEWAKMNGYNTSTYLGQPIVKFTKLYIRIERRDGSQQSSGLSNVRKSWCWQMDQERLVWAIKNISRQNTLQIVWTSKTRKRQAKLSALSKVIHKTINSDMATTQTIPEFFFGGETSNVFGETSPDFQETNVVF